MTGISSLNHICLNQSQLQSRTTSSPSVLPLFLMLRFDHTLFLGVEGYVSQVTLYLYFNELLLYSIFLKDIYNRQSWFLVLVESYELFF